ncbi:hypothetical protein [Mycoplasma sp. Sp33II]|uniref:hypothetical protein n=1 Tax=unclassified Mycoplasma TaxID=2683645 RepID=UPI003AAA9290
MSENTKYSKYTEFCNQIKIGKEEFQKTNFYNYLFNKKNDNGFDFIMNQNVFKANITSFSNEACPDKLRIRNDKFLKLATERKMGLLIAPYKMNNKIYFCILTTLWFYNYSSSISSSNSFIIFDHNKLLDYTKNMGVQYKTIKTNKIHLINNDKFVKYALLIISDEDIEKFNDLKEYIINSYTSRGDIANFIERSKNIDPTISSKTRNSILNLSKNRCLINYINPNHCNTKMDWDATYEAIKGTGLNVPVDIHHFITREWFKDVWQVSETESDLDWDFIHNEINLIPLCKLCHQSIHNKNKRLSKLTFSYIIQALKYTNRYDNFLKYLEESNVVKSIDDLLLMYTK